MFNNILIIIRFMIQVPSLLEHGKTTKKMDTENNIGQTVLYMRVNGRIIRQTGTGD